MPKKSAKVGFVGVKQDADGRWRVRWWDSATKRMMRRILPATSYTEATAMAREISKTMAEERGFLPALRGGARGHTVDEAIKEAIKNTGAITNTRKNYTSRANRFIDWLNEYRPGVTSWVQIDTKMLLDYLEHCRIIGLAPDSIRLRWHIPCA